jgi:hypothetical protein
MGIRALCLTVGLLGPAMAGAEADVAGLQDSLARLPVAAAGRAEVWFADVAAGLALADPGLAADDPNRLAGLVMPGLEVRVDGLPAWPATVGFGPNDLGQVLSFGVPPETGVVLRLSPSAARAVPGVLVANGYAPEDMGVPTLLARGEDFGVDFAALDPGDPFSGGIGAASRVAITPDGWLWQARGWPVIDRLLAPGPTLADRPDLAALIAGLGQEGQGALVNALILPDPLAMQAGPPLSPDMDPALLAQPPGLPDWSLALIADLQDGDQATGVIALAYATADQAQAGADRMLANWTGVRSMQMPRTFADLTGGTARAAVAGQGPYAALLIVTAPMDGWMNPVWNRMVAAYVGRDMVFLPFLPPS